MKLISLVCYCIASLMAFYDILHELFNIGRGLNLQGEINMLAIVIAGLAAGKANR